MLLKAKIHELKPLKTRVHVYQVDGGIKTISFYWARNVVVVCIRDDLKANPAENTESQQDNNDSRNNR